MKQFYRPMLTTFLVALGAACLWIATQSSHHVAAAPIATPTQSTMAGMNHADSDIIDGSKHPELVPDSTAYRLFLIAATEGDPTPTQDQLVRQHALLLDTHMPKQSFAAVGTILMNFRTQYAALIANYNGSWYVTHQSQAGLAQFLAERDALVQSTRDRLKNTLPADAMKTFDAHVQHEKLHMKVAKAEAQQ